MWWFCQHCSLIFILFSFSSATHLLINWINFPLKLGGLQRLFLLLFHETIRKGFVNRTLGMNHFNVFHFLLYLRIKRLFLRNIWIFFGFAEHFNRGLNCRNPNAAQNSLIDVYYFPGLPNEKVEVRDQNLLQNGLAKYHFMCSLTAILNGLLA